MAIQHFNIPIFIPELACPHRCIFCNQSRISGVTKIPEPKDVSAIVSKYLSTLPSQNSKIQIAFFGGSFTALPIHIQEEYLSAVQPFMTKNISGIRISTRPDYIDETVLKMLKNYHVTNIELGAQSMDNAVLRQSARGHSSEEVRAASKQILEHQFILGLQMMIGLPGDTDEKALNTAREIVATGATETRIYPTLVIRNTPLETLWASGKYLPLELQSAVSLSAKLFRYFENNGVKVLRTGLFPSSDLTEGEGLLAGPFHAHFKELVMSEIWREIFLNANWLPKQQLHIYVSQESFNHAVGFRRSNINFFAIEGLNLKIKADKTLEKYDFHVDYR